MNRALSSLKTADAFRKVFRKGRAFAGGRYVLYILEHEEPVVRYGIVISKKCGNSVVRHRFARVVREVLRTYRPQIKKNADLVVLPKKGVTYARANEIRYKEAEEILLGLLKRAHAI